MECSRIRQGAFGFLYIRKPIYINRLRKPARSVQKFEHLAGRCVGETAAVGSRQVSEIAMTIEIFCVLWRVGTLLAYSSGKKKIYSSYANCSASWFFFDDLGCVKTLL
jgi:hypothetical protein